MKIGVLPLNIILSLVYIVISALVLFFLKMANLPLQRISVSQSRQERQENLNYNKLIVVSWLKKYTFIGGLFCKDKKYILKEFLFISAYAVSCLSINAVIIWPVLFTIFLIPVIFVVFELILKRFHHCKIEEMTPKNKTIGNKVNIVNHQQSDAEIEMANNQQIHSNHIIQLNQKQSAKITLSISRTSLETIILGIIALMSIVMLFEAVYVLSNSISNSGELNIQSILLIMCIDQFAIRTSVGLLFFTVLRIVAQANPKFMEGSYIVNMVCQEQITDIKIAIQEQKRKREVQMTASPPNKKTISPSRIPKAVGSNGQIQTYLNLINLQPTIRKITQQSEPHIQEIYLTTLQKQLFENGQSEEDKSQSQMSTRRRANKENNQISYLSAAQKRIQEEQQEDIDDIIIGNNPLKVCNRVDEFHLGISPVNYTKRRGPIKKKNKRVLNLTGSSPYLQYLPDMLKKVDKYKEHLASKQIRKIL